MPPMHTGLEYNNWHDCMVAGYTQSKEFLQTSGSDYINKNQITPLKIEAKDYIIPPPKPKINND